MTQEVLFLLQSVELKELYQILLWTAQHQYRNKAAYNNVKRCLALAYCIIAEHSVHSLRNLSRSTFEIPDVTRYRSIIFHLRVESRIERTLHYLYLKSEASEYRNDKVIAVISMFGRLIITNYDIRFIVLYQWQTSYN